jgi:hypothetical protein
MSESVFIHVSSFDELSQRLHQKYREGVAQYTSTFRYPSSIIFFDSKQEYKRFIQESSWEIRTLSEAFEGKDETSCYQIRKWLSSLLSEHGEKPVVVLPITEYIRMCKPHNPPLIDQIFTTIVQAEFSSIIVPMLDYSFSYQKFFADFPHQERMAEVFSYDSPEKNQDSAIKVILDETGMVPTEGYEVITTLKSWIKLWETGEIADKNSLIIQNKRIIEAIKDTDISVPKVNKRVVKDQKDYLAYYQNIDPSCFTIEPDTTIWNVIFSNLYPDDHKNSWNKIATTILGSTDNLEEDITEYWEDSSRSERRVQRWFWLNEAKKRSLSSPFLERVVKEVEDPEQLLDYAYNIGIASNEIDAQSLRERVKLLKKFKKPLFSAGILTFEQKYVEWKERQGDNYRKIIEHTTGIFPFERQALVEVVPLLMREQSGFPGELFPIIEECWPTFAAYIEPVIGNSPAEDISIKSDPQGFADQYSAQYIFAKLAYDAPTKRLEKLQHQYFVEWNDILGALSIGKIPQHNDTSFKARINNDGYIFLDGVGYEWHNVLRVLFERKGWKITSIQPLFSQLPSDTAHFPLSDPVKTYRDFDGLIHKYYRYPTTIFEELEILEQIVEEIHQWHKDRPIWIVSDHGSTAFARKGKARTIKGVKKEHGGRCGTFKGDFLNEDGRTHCVAEKTASYAVSLSYDNYGETSPQGEAHGGAMPEETLALALLIVPSGADKSSEQITVKPERDSYSTFDPDIVLLINGAAGVQIESVNIRINKGTRRSIPMEWVEKNTIKIPIATMRESGFKPGENTLDITFNKTIQAACSVEYTSGSAVTEFDQVFKL